MIIELHNCSPTIQYILYEIPMHVVTRGGPGVMRLWDRALSDSEIAKEYREMKS